MQSDPAAVGTRPELGNNTADRCAAVMRSAFGFIPYIGPVLAELVTAIIPNQRLDRVEVFLRLLSQEMEKLNAAANVKEPSSIPLVEEGIAQAARAFSDERKEYLAKCVAQGLKVGEQDKLRELKILKILGELGDDELLLLDAHVEPGGFRRRKSLAPERAFLSDTDDVKAQHQLHRASFRRLEAMGLLHFCGTGSPDGRLGYRNVGRMQGNYRLTPLGRVLLSRVGLGASPSAGSVD